jgi:hypothetical protein
MRRSRGFHRRRNPSGNLIWGVAGAAGGYLLTGTAAAMVAPGGTMNYVVQGAVALGGGYLLSRWKKPAGYGFTIGGLAKLAIQVYSDYVGGVASPGASFYAQSNFPVPTFTPSGNPNNWPAFSPGGSSTLPVGTSPAAAATISATGGKYTKRLAGRFSH